MKASDLKGMAVVSIDGGAKLGYIDDVLFDSGGLRVAALRINADKQKALVPFDQVKSIGSDAVTVQSNDVTQWIKPESESTTQPGLDQIGKLKVVNEAGTLLGTVNTVEVDPQAGSITQVQSHKGGVLGLGGSTFTIPAKQIISVGTEVMTVSAPDPES
jgi:uncharacterized protein YrrD